MKKIIRITESDLTNIVKRVIKENDLKDSLIDVIKNDGWREATDMVGGDKNLMKILNIDSPMDFLHLFDDLDVVQSEERPNWTLFRYEPKKNIMFYDKKNRQVYINYHKIWKILDEVFNLNTPEIQELTQEWLSEVYNLRGVITLRPYLLHSMRLSEVYNLRGVITQILLGLSAQQVV